MKKKILFFVLFTLTSYLYSQTPAKVILPQRPENHSIRDYKMTDKGFWIAAELEGASSIMQSKPNMQHATATFTAGYRFNEYIRIGAGIGAKVYVHNASVRDTGSKCCIPLFLNARGNFLCKHDRKAAPYWSMSVGGVTSDGFFANPVLGYSFGGLRHNFLLGISYTISTFKDVSNTNRAYSYFGIKLGYEF